MILAYADAMLKPGGVLVYSTCTFAPQEDEEQVSDFLDKHDEYFIEPWEDFLPTDTGINTPGNKTMFRRGNTGRIYINLNYPSMFFIPSKSDNYRKRHFHSYLR